MSLAAAVVSTVKLFAAPSAVIAAAASALTGFAVPAVPVNTSTLPASAAAGATPIAAVASIAPANASDLRMLRETGGKAALDNPIPTPSSEDQCSPPSRTLAVTPRLSPSGSADANPLPIKCQRTFASDSSKEVYSALSTSTTSSFAPFTARLARVIEP